MCSSCSAYLTGYGYYQDGVVNNTGSAQTDFQVMFVVNTSSGTSSGSTIYLNSHSEADLDDLRFTSTSDTVYDYWIESTANPYNVWVEIPSIPAGNSTIRVQYGNASSSAYSNGTNTFPFFDDFLGTSLNTDKWTLSGTPGSNTVGSGVDTLVGGAYYLSGDVIAANNVIMRTRMKTNRWDVSSTYLQQVGFVNGAIDFSDNYINFNFAHLSSDYTKYLVQQETTAGGWTKVAADSGDWAANTYGIVEIKRANDHAVLAINDVVQVTLGTSDYPTGNLYPYFCSYTSGDTETIDWIAIRKYAATLPTILSWSGETVIPVTPVAGFTANVTYGYPPFVISFTDSSTNTPTVWSWLFGDGGTASTKNTTHWYNVSIGNTPTSYTVSLNASNAAGYDWENKTNYITAYPLNASFSANVTSGTAPLAVAFTDYADNGTPTTWWWDFNEDGIQDDANQSPTYTFTSAGLYNISLNASNAYSWDWLNRTDYINATTVIPPVASFTSNVSYGYPNFSVQFTDTSTGSPTSWTWYVNLTPVSSAQNLIRAFDDVIGNTPRPYWIILNASNAGGYDWADGYITSYPLNASFSANVTSGYQALPVLFTDASNNGTATSWYYDFGDGNTCSTAQNPVNIYRNVGTYTVLQNVSNAYSWDWENKTYYINVLQNEISAGFTANATLLYASDCNNGAVQLTDTTTANGTLPDTWEWYVDGVLTDWTQNPTILFGVENQSAPVCYFVSLNASNSYDYDWENKSSYICSYPLNTSFTANITSGCGPLTVEFSDLSTNGTPNRWNWSFGDGTYSNLSTPTHTYTTVGDFDVRLNSYTVGTNTSYICSFDTELKSTYIHVTGLSPTASFTANVTGGYPAFAVAFTDTTGAGPSTYYWDFGDGETDNVQNPVHTYDSVIGNTLTQYTVNFNIDPGCGSDWENKTSYITSYPLNANFTANTTNGDIPLIVTFIDSTNNGTPTSWWWDFNEDGIQDDANQSPTYTYTIPGVYNVTLNASNAYSWDWLNRTDYITATNPSAPPVAAFTANVTSGYPAFAVAFTDTSTESPSSWYWDFGDGDTDNVQNPVHTYDSVIGNSITTYSVKLKATNADGNDWENKTSYITVYPLSAGFSANVTTGCSLLNVGFTDGTTNGTPTTWAWDFGDGNSSALQNPTHIYSSTGTYYVSLNASNAYSWDIENKTAYITVNVSGVTSAFSGAPTSGAAPLLVTFTDSSTANCGATVTSWYWDFGDGNTSILQNPTNNYTADGIYDVHMRATNSDGISDWENKTGYITVSAATPTPTPTTSGGGSISAMPQSANLLNVSSLMSVGIALGAIAFGGVICVGAILMTAGRRRRYE